MDLIASLLDTNGKGGTAKMREALTSDTLGVGVGAMQRKGKKIGWGMVTNEKYLYFPCQKK